MKSGVLEVAAFAADAHARQRRKGGAQEPYIGHPLRVAALLEAVGVTDEDVLKAALLHDVVEDTPRTLADVSALAGPNVASIVAEVSDDKSLPKATRKLLQIEHARTASLEARLVKLADKIDNVSSMVDAPPVGWTRTDVLRYAVWSSTVADACMRTINDESAVELYELLHTHVKALGVTAADYTNPLYSYESTE